MDVSTSPNMVSQMQPDPLCGGCPPPGSVPQSNSYWPVQNSGPAFPSWPGPSAQLTQTTQAQAPCWTGQPGVTPCWTTTQQVPVSAPAPIMMPAPAPSPAQAPPMVQTPAVAPAPAVVQAPAMVQGPAPLQPCQTQPCWPPSQYQPTSPPVQVQIPAPAQVPPPVLTPVPVTAPAAGPRPSIWPAHPGWPYNPGQSGWPGQNPNVLPHYWVPTTSGPLSVPYNLNLARGVYDKMMMTILGQVKPNARMFTVNFIKGSDIAFHINPRFSEGGKQVVVRNHKLGERWGTEERELKGPFPFAQGSPFEMKILCTHESFRVAVNNTPLFEFRHRVRELNQIDRINILHDVVLNYVNVETLP